MKVVALISGGKDSCFNMMHCVSEGHQIVALANLRPESKDEMDSYMFQTVGHHAIDIYAEATGLPLYRRTISGFSKSIGRDYEPTNDDEVEDLYELLKMVMNEIQIEAVSVGAILSDYQRVRVENVCQRLNLTSLAYLWRRDQETLLKEMLDCHVEAIVIKVAALGLDIDKHLGKSLQQIYSHMIKMNKTYGLNVCGEGGEYETFTLDCPLFVKKIVIDHTETVIHSDDAFAQVGYLNLHKLHLEDKPVVTDIQEYLKTLPLTRSSDLLNELTVGEEITNSSQISESPSLTQCSETKETFDVSCKELGNWFYVSGIVAKIESSQTVEEVTRTVMEKMKKTVEDMGFSMENIVSVCLYVHSMKEFAQINSVYKKFFGINPPVRVCVEVCNPPNVALILDCCGCVCDQQEPTMHVQSISHWAPANIGPYSQACKRGDKIFVAGQIAMIPATLQITDGGINTQCLLSLRHTQRILTAIHSGCTLDRVTLAVCYVTHRTYVVTAQKQWNKTLLNYKTNSSDDETENRSLLQIVVVPALPKGALIEWQVSAYVRDEELQEHFINEKDDSNSVSFHCYCSRENKTLFSCVGMLECPKMSDNAQSYKKFIRHMFECFNKLIKKTLFNWSDIPLLRIFYSVSHSSQANLYTVLLQSLTEVAGDDHAPIISLIPVIQNGCNENTLLSLCCS